ncbi:sigma-70 family RNA polymerase sigma factor [Candidatus Dojkabacteria bacterium]|nr:sigma-70 family RNA polymerase sigma factor [Candidatus Dojkabacteria bacterium]
MDKTQLETLYNENIVKIYRFFYSRTLSQAVSEELTSQTFLAFAENSRSKTTIENPVGYLYGIAKHIFISYLKQKGHEIPLEIERLEIYEEIEQTTYRIESNGYTQSQIETFIDRLPEKQRQIAKLRLLQKLKTKEICEKICKDNNYVKTTMKRAIKSLRLMIAMQPSVPPDALIN